MSSKTFALDTSVVLNDPRALFSFEDNTVVLTEYVLYELDEKKRGTEEINQNTREVGRQLEWITEGLSDQIIKSQADNQKELPPEASTGISRPIDIPGTTCKLVLLMDDRKDPVRGATRDDKILELLNRYRKDFKTPIIVVTKDTLMGIKALGLGFGRQNYRREQSKTQIRKLPVITADKISRASDLFGKGKCKEPEILQKTYQDCQGKDRIIAPGYFVLDYGNERSGLLHINREGEIRLITRTPTICRSATTRGLNAKNLEQNAAIDALLNPEKTLVCLLGPAGTGKTLLAIGAAIHHTRQQLSRTAVKAAEGEGKEERLTRRQRKQLRTQEEKLANGQETERLQIYITRPQVSMGKEMGLLPLAVRSNSTRQTRGAGSRAQRLLGRGFRRGGAGHANRESAGAGAGSSAPEQSKKPKRCQAIRVRRRGYQGPLPEYEADQPIGVARAKALARSAV